jgi:serine/threonine protein kinase
MPLSSGDKLGSYEILALIGKGGMGEVYCARDTKLKREVAITCLSVAIRSQIGQVHVEIATNGIKNAGLIGIEVPGENQIQGVTDLRVVLVMPTAS